MDDTAETALLNYPTFFRRDGSRVGVSVVGRVFVEMSGEPRRWPAPGGEEFKRLMQEITDGAIGRLRRDEKLAAELVFKRKEQDFPPVALWQPGELAMVLRKDEKGQVRKLGGWVVQVLAPNRSMDATRGFDGSQEMFWMDHPNNSSLHESTRGTEKLVLVSLPEAIMIPARVSYGLEPSRHKHLPTPRQVHVSTVAVPDHWLRRLTAAEASRIKAPRVAA